MAFHVFLTRLEKGARRPISIAVATTAPIIIVATLTSTNE